MTTRGRWTARANVLVSFALILLAADAALDGDTRRAVVAVVALVASSYSSLAAVAAAVLAAILGVWPVAALALVGAALAHPALIGFSFRSVRPDADALSTAFGALPADLHTALRTAAGAGPITTWHIVAHAKQRRPGSWRPLLGSDPGAEAFDGPPIADPRGGTCSQFAAEAAAIAKEMAAVARRSVDSDVLAAAATMAVHSCAHEWVDGDPWTSMGVSPAELMEGFNRFGRTSAAAALIARGERAMSLPSTVHAMLPRERLATLSRGQAIRARAGLVGIYVWALGAVLWDGIRALAWWRRGAEPAAPAALEAPERPVGAHKPERPVGAEKAKESVKPAAPKEPRERGRARRRVDAALRPWQPLPLPARVAWLGLRPLLTLAAVTAAIAVDRAAWWAVAATAAAALITALRVPALALVLAALTALAAPVAGGLLAVRAIAGELVLLGVGRREGRSRRGTGIDAIVTARLALAEQLDLGGQPYAEARRQQLAAAQAPDPDEDVLLERALVVVSAAWAEMRPIELGRALVGLARGGLTGRWDGFTGPVDFDVELRRIVIVETAGRAALRAGGVAAAALTAAAVVGPVPWPAADSGILALAPPAVAAAAIAVATSRRRPGVASALVFAVVAWFALGAEDAPAAIAIGALLGAATHPARRGLERRTLGGPDADPWPPPRGAPRALRRLWRAADEAASEGRAPVAIEMLEEVIRRAPHMDELVSECDARIALWHLEAAQIGLAAARLDRLVDRAADDARKGRPSLTPAGSFAVGMLQAQLGADEDARVRLALALEQATAGTALARRIASSLAEVHARAGDAASAQRVLEAHPPPRLGAAGIGAAIDREVIIAFALYQGDDRRAALARLEEVTSFPLSGSVQIIDYGRKVMQRIASAEGRAHLLAGRLKLEGNAWSGAGSLLETAITLLSAEADAEARAVAHVLLGRTLVDRGRSEEGLDAIRKGLDVLEERRGQVTSSSRRTGMIVATGGVYEHALAALARLDGGAGGPVGMLGAVLIESLRRNALGEMLRRGRMQLPPALSALLVGVDRRDAEAADGAIPLEQLTVQLSRHSARAFKSAPVTPDALAAVARRNGHVVAYYVPPRSPIAWCAWVTPQGVGHLEPVVAAGDDDALTRLREAEGFRGEEIYSPWDDSGPVWRQLAESLLPDGLRALLAEADSEKPVALVVIPDGYLAGVPWAALDVGGEPLVRRAVIQLAPSYELVGTGHAADHNGARGVVAHATPQAIELLRQRMDVAPASRRDAFLAALDARRYRGAYIGTHGERTGLEQRVEFPDGEWLSAAGALLHAWPDWVIFAACVVGRIDPVVGGEPLGLPISCMLGGSSSVVAAVVRITGGRPDEPTPATVRLFAEVGAGLGEHRPPAGVLRAAQLRYLDRMRSPSVADGLGAVCLSTRSPASA